MNSFEINKILGALLGTCLVLVAVHIAAGAIFSQEAPAKPGYEIAVKEEASQGAAPAAPAEVPIATLLASASAERGAQVAKQCQACHNFQEGQGPKVGPDLYGVVGRPIAAVSGFNYSAALNGKQGKWDFDTLNAWLTKPSAFAPGTAMTFAGLTNDKQRADVIAYLDSLSANPVPLPKAQGQSAAAPAANGPGSSPAAGAPSNAPPAAAGGTPAPAATAPARH
ncbi:MAG TPA: cytochrome c family protein [Xanthobacteraceae bacterium]|nr:cytochrome c family protein [Xanthobacteraceae bacterium]